MRRTGLWLMKKRDFTMRRILASKIAKDAPAADFVQDEAMTASLGEQQKGTPARRRLQKVSLRRGEEVADEVRMLTDAEWEALPLADKHAFTKHIAKKIRDTPSSVTEQQRRRYYETTMKDPRDEQPGRTVLDMMERVRLGLPAEITPDRRSLGVSPAMYEKGDATLFSVDNAHKIEHAVTEVKQMFVDYIRKKKEGVSTEHERRALANATEELHFETQRHFANMFKYAEQRARDIIIEERVRQLRRIAAVRRALRKKTGDRDHEPDKKADGARLPTENSEPAGGAVAKQRQEKPKAMSRAERVKKTLREAYGLDVTTAQVIWSQMMAQERFLRLCEVMTRMTLGRGFSHSSADESLDEYTARLRDIYSTDPKRLGRVDAVQYLAATEGVQPVDWAARWYENTLLLPLQATPEYKEVMRIKQEEEELARVAAGGQEDASKPRGDGSGAEPASSDADASPALKAPSTPHDSNAVDLVPDGPAHRAEARARSLISKIFADPDDERLQSQHEKRLRYIAHLHLESQVKRLRDNAKLFDGCEQSEEAARCRELYDAIRKRREALLQDKDCPDAVRNNPFCDPQIRSDFDELRGICEAYVKKVMERVALDEKAARAARLTAALQLGKPEALEDALRDVRLKRKREQVDRMLRLLEKDVREDMLWAENMAEAERPPPLPLPEPMSYISAADIRHWEDIRAAESKDAGSPFHAQKKKALQASFLGQPWKIPDKPTLFWGTGAKAVEQALKHAAEDADRRRGALPALPPGHPCAENPWGWRLRHDVLDDDDAPSPAAGTSSAAGAGAGFITH